MAAESADQWRKESRHEVRPVGRRVPPYHSALVYRVQADLSNLGCTDNQVMLVSVQVEFKLGDK
jgi:hypothetical protein